MSREYDDILGHMQNMLDEHAIKKLQYKYARLMDDGFCKGNIQARELAHLWSEDGVWDGGESGRYQGRTAIEEFFIEHARHVKFANHYVANEEISVTGNTGKSRCLLLVPATFIVNEAEVEEWLFVAWYNSFVKLDDGAWYFSELVAEVFKHGSHG